jgi:phosphate transport system permease protein
MNLVLISLILLLGFSSYFFGRKKALVIQSSQRLTALPKFYGYYLSIWCAVPALIIFALWSVFEPSIVKSLILSDYDGQILTKNELQLTYTKIKALALGNYSGNITNFLDNSANKYLQIKGIADNAKIVIILSILIFSLSYAYKSIQNNNRMREPVEIFLKWLLFTASLAAVLVTLGIIFSLLFEAIRFFQAVPFFDFIFGTHWYPAKTFVRDASRT